MYRDDITSESADPGGASPQSVSLFDAVQNIYRSALGRDGSAEDIEAWIAGTGGDLAKIHQGILASDEYKKKTAAPPSAGTGDVDQPVITGGGGGGGGFGPTGTSFGSLMAPYTGQFTAPATSNALGQIPALPNFGTFSYPDFVGPGQFQGVDPTTITSNPAYQFRFDEGRRALTNSRAAEGLLRSGGTLTDFMKYGQNMASTEYDNEWNRQWAQHKGAFDESLNAWNAGLQKQLATTTLNRDPLMEEWRTKAQAAQRQSEDDWTRAWTQHQADFDVFKYNQQWPYSVLSDQQRVGLDATR
jgi:hypothetical protein